MIIKTKPGQSVYNYFLELIGVEFNRLIKEEFKDVFDRSPVKVKLFIGDTMNKLWNTRINTVRRGYLSHSEILDDIRWVRLTTRFTPFESRYTVRVQDGSVSVKELSVLVNEDSFKTYFIDALDNGFRDFEENLRLSVRHEIGHIIDYISFEKMSGKEFDEMYHRRREEKDDFYRRWEHAKNDEEDRRRMEEYYQMEAEATANLLVGINIKDMIDNDFETRNKSDESIVLEIDSKFEKEK